METKRDRCNLTVARNTENYALAYLIGDRPI